MADPQYQSSPQIDYGNPATRSWKAPVSTGRSTKGDTDQDVVNRVYVKGKGPANSRGVQIARGIDNTAKKVQAIKKRAASTREGKS